MTTAEFASIPSSHARDYVKSHVHPPPISSPALPYYYYEVIYTSVHINFVCLVEAWHVVRMALMPSSV
jgi:hypothetical protein